MLLSIGVFSFILGLALLLLSGILMLLDILWDFGEVIFKIAVILMLAPIVIVLLLGAFASLIGLFGFTLLF